MFIPPPVKRQGVFAMQALEQPGSSIWLYSTVHPIVIFPYAELYTLLLVDADTPLQVKRSRNLFLFSLSRRTFERLHQHRNIRERNQHLKKNEEVHPTI